MASHKLLTLLAFDIVKKLIAVCSFSTEGRKRECIQPASDHNCDDIDFQAHYVHGTLTTPWSDLPEDNLEEILNKIDLPQDYLNFTAVCKSWHSISQKNNNYRPYNLPLYHFLPKENAIPLLFQPYEEGGDKHYLYSVTEQKVYDGLPLPELSNKWIIGSSNGWLVTVDFSNLQMCLLNPLTRVQISVPSVSAIHKPFSHHYDDTKDFIFVNRVFLSSNPEVDKGKCLLVASVSCQRTLSFCNIGDNKWRKVEPPIFNIDDVIIYKGLLYAVDSFGNLFFIETTPCMKVTIVAKFKGRSPGRQFLVESPDGILLVVRRRKYVDVEHIKTISFQVYRLVRAQSGYHHQSFETADRVIHYQEEIVWNTWDEIEHLNGQMLFVGYNRALYLDPCLYPGSKTNSIYFADMNILCDIVRVKGLEHNPHDIGVYDMENRRIELFSGLSISSSRLPAIWLSPNP